MDRNDRCRRKKICGKYITRLDTFGIVGFSEVDFIVKV